MHVCPPAQSTADWQVPQVPPDTQPCPVAQFAAVPHEQLSALQVPVAPHCASDVHCPHKPPAHASPWVQSRFVPHAVVQVPDPQAWPVAQSPLELQEQ